MRNKARSTKHEARNSKARGAGALLRNQMTIARKINHKLQITNYKQISKDNEQKKQTKKSFAFFVCFAGLLLFGILNLCILNLFRVSDFGFRIY